MTYLVDTNWLVSFFNGRAQAVELIEQLTPQGISISIITCGEIYEGFEVTAHLPMTAEPLS
jgi:predicted nucleic acid-binding protein